jgi:hypothetical protein
LCGLEVVIVVQQIRERGLIAADDERRRRMGLREADDAQAAAFGADFEDAFGCRSAGRLYRSARRLTHSQCDVRLGAKVKKDDAFGGHDELFGSWRPVAILSRVPYRARGSEIAGQPTPVGR